MISEHLILKKIDEKDRAHYVSQVMMDNVMRYITGKGLSEIEAHKRFDLAMQFGLINPNFGIFSVRLKDTSTYIGLARMKLDENGSVEIGYNLLENFWGKGYGFEVAKMLMDFLILQTEKRIIYALIEPENIGSVKIIEKLGFQKTDEKTDEKTFIYRFINAIK
jgi:[ribosomal protein S5]-alanine N-acetyltransferase